MNKQELLKDLESKDFVDAINGKPELKEQKADGGRWYLVNIREVNPDGQSAVYRNIHFYVIDEGTENERAYYKDSVLTAVTQRAYNFRERLENFIDNASDKYIIERIDEKREIAIVKRYTESDDTITEARYFVFVKDGKLLYKRIK